MIANVLRENLRNKALYVITGIGFLLMMAMLAGQGGTVKDAAGNDLLKDALGAMRVGFALIGVLGSLVTIVLSMSTMPREFERKTIHLLLVRPVSRWQVAGSFLVGNILTAWVLLLVLCVPLFFALTAKGAPDLAPRIFAAIPALALNLALITAVTTLASVWMPAPAAAFVGLLVYGFAAFSGTLGAIASISRESWAPLLKLFLFLLPPTDGVARETLKLFGPGAGIDLRVYAGGLFYLWAAAGLVAGSLYRREV